MSAGTTAISPAEGETPERVVAEIQRVPRFLSTEYTAGCCEFCLWRGKERPRTQEGIRAADAESRSHLGKVHPAKVTYWAEPETPEPTAPPSHQEKP